jgi:para-nitrobenzyl esterase
MCVKLLTVFGLALGVMATWPAAPLVHTQAPSCQVTTSQGDVLGVDRGSSCAFLGVPFGAPPTANLRWRPPVGVPAWAPATLNATISPLACGAGPQGSEDCLKLNIWAPYRNAGPPKPVIVWLHPGSFFAASANLSAQNGERLAEQTGTIVVAPNYRLGPFGFLAHEALRSDDPAFPSAGNYGLLDQRLALRWVRDHIADFGGDPTRLTVAGQSAGALSVGLHLVAPDSWGLFDRAIMQGGVPSYRWRTRADGATQGEAFATQLGCTDPATVLPCLREKTRNEILAALPTGNEQFAEGARTHWSPVVDGFVIPDQPRTLFEIGAFSKVPVIIGSNRDEGWTFVNRSFPDTPTGPYEMSQEEYESAVSTEFGADAPAILAAYSPAEYAGKPKEALSKLVDDAEYACGAARLARVIEHYNLPVYLYSLHYSIANLTPGRAFHGIDVNLVFGNNFGPPSPPHTLTPDDENMFRTISGYWTRFAASGNPNLDDPNVVLWPAFKHPVGPGRGSDKYLILDTTTREALRLREEQCAFWEPYFFRSITAAVPAHTP